MVEAEEGEIENNILPPEDAPNDVFMELLLEFQV